MDLQVVKMKIVGLMVTFNEEHFIHYSFPILHEVVDEVVVLDGSIDKTREYFKNFDNVHVYHEEDYLPMSYQERRQFTIDRAREREATHFICIDADEVMDIGLAHTIKGMLPLLKRGQGISCNWYHIVNDLYTRSDSIDCSVQSIGWCDNGDNLSGRDLIHEDKFPPGHSMQGKSYLHINKPLLHFGGFNTTYFNEKRMFYKCVEYLESQDVYTINLTYYRKLDNHTVKFFCHYPMNLSNGIIHGPPNNKFLDKIINIIRLNHSNLKDFYKLDIWRYNPSILNYCKDNIDGFDESKIRYKSWMPDIIVFLDMTIRQTFKLLITGKVNRILLYIYRCVLWRLYGDANSSYKT